MRCTRLSKSAAGRKTFLRKLTRLETLPPVKKIVLTRWEGRPQECGKPVTVRSFAEAEHVLDMWRLSAPGRGMGYDKTGFLVTFKDGRSYEGRYDLNRENYAGHGDSPTLKEHIVAVQQYAQGVRK